MLRNRYVLTSLLMGLIGAVVLVALGFKIVSDIQAANTDTKVLVRVTEPFRAAGNLSAKPEVTTTILKVVEGPGRFTAGKTVVIEFKWPCTHCDDSNWDDAQKAMREANNDALATHRDGCYVLIIQGKGNRARFNSEIHNVSEVPCP